MPPPPRGTLAPRLSSVPNPMETADRAQLLDILHGLDCALAHWRIGAAAGTDGGGALSAADVRTSKRKRRKQRLARRRAVANLGVLLGVWPRPEQRPRRITGGRLLACAIHRKNFYGPLVWELEARADGIRDELLGMLKMRAATWAGAGSGGGGGGGGGGNGEGGYGEDEDDDKGKTVALPSSVGTQDDDAVGTDDDVDRVFESKEPLRWYRNQEGIASRPNDWLQRHVGCRYRSDGKPGLRGRMSTPAFRRPTQKICEAVHAAMSWYYAAANADGTPSMTPSQAATLPTPSSASSSSAPSSSAAAERGSAKRTTRAQVSAMATISSRNDHDAEEAPEQTESRADQYWGRAALSVLGPGQHVRAHTGPVNERVVISLGLAGDFDAAELRVANATRKWGRGEAIVFDDSFEHEVRVGNVSGMPPRAVLILHVLHPQLMPAGTNGHALAMSMEPSEDGEEEEERTEVGGGGATELEPPSAACEEGYFGMVNWITTEATRQAHQTQALADVR